MTEKKQNKSPIYSGYRVGKLTVVEEASHRRGRFTVWRCRCDCGNEYLPVNGQLTQELKKSCDCLQKIQVVKNLKLVDGTSVTKIESNRKKLLANNTSGYNGVYRNSKTGKWIAQLILRGKLITLRLMGNGWGTKIENQSKNCKGNQKITEHFNRDFE